jgi:H+-transporting ATPase
VIAKETARALGLGANIQEAGGLPSMDADGKIPKDLGKKYGAMIIAADGFAQVSQPCQAIQSSQHAW